MMERYAASQTFGVLCNLHADCVSHIKALAIYPEPERLIAMLQAHADQALRDAHTLMDRHDDMVRLTPGVIISSCAPELIQRLPIAKPGAVSVNDDGTLARRIADIATPDDLRLMLSRGLQLGQMLPILFDALTARHRFEPDRIEALAEVIARESAPREKYLSAQGYTLLFMPEGRAIRTPLFAETLRAQLRAFPDLDVTILSYEPSLDDVIKIYLARDMSLETVSDMTFDDPETQAFIQATRSNHGKMQILARTGSLADYLAKEPITTWRSGSQT